MLKVTDTNFITTGYFGKLPKFADFVKYNASGDEILLIDNWIQEGIRLAKLKYKNNWKNYYNNTSSFYFIFPFTNTDKITIGIISPSNDKSGRSFPFIIFGIIKRDLIESSKVHLLPLNFKEYYESLNEILKSNSLKKDLSEMKSQTINLSNVTLPANSNENIYENYLSNSLVENLYQKISINSDNDTVQTVIDLFRNRIEILEHSPGVNLNFNSGTDNDLLNICFYIQLLLKIFNRSNFFPAVFWNNRKENVLTLSLFFQKPTPLNFLDLIYFDNENSNDTMHEKKEEEYLSQDLPSIFKKNLTIDYSHSLKEFIDYFNV